MIPSDFPPIVDTQMEEVEEEKTFKNVRRKLIFSEDDMDVDEDAMDIDDNKENVDA